MDVIVGYLFGGIIGYLILILYKRFLKVKGLFFSLIG